MNEIGPAYYLSIMAMARNECPSYPEWLAHHRTYGVQHFYVIDNDSSDSCEGYLSAQPDVTVWSWTLRAEEVVMRSVDRNASGYEIHGRLGNQMMAYNHFLPRVLAEWVAIIDLDEFIWSPNGTVATVLQSLPLETRQVCLPWLSFGSGNLTAQPSCVTATNVLRMDTSHPGLAIGKCIMRTRQIASVQIHRSVMFNETYHRRIAGCSCGDFRASCGCCGHTGPSPSAACHSLTPSRLEAQQLRLHHYISQSREHMLRKSHVGEADLGKRVRDDKYWKWVEYYHNRLKDTSLAERSVCRASDDASSHSIDD